MNPTDVQGAWRLGWTLDVHTTSSEFLGYDANGHAQFQTARSELGELVYQLKYRGESSAAGEIASVMASFLSTKPNAMARLDAVVPMPASIGRPVQPVVEVSRELGSRLGKPVLTDVVRKVRETPSLKDIHDAERRRELLDGAFEVDRSKVEGLGLLLIDDLYWSGATANSVSLALIGAGAARVYLLAATRTRSTA